MPCLVRWTGKIARGTVSARVTGFEDWLPTLLELIGVKTATPAGLDGISFAPTLLGGTQPERPFLYRESQGNGGQQCVRVGDWKAIRLNLHPPANAKKKATAAGSTAIELYNLKSDPAETTNVAAQHPEVVAQLAAIMRRERVPTALWPIKVLDEEAK